MKGHLTGAIISAGAHLGIFLLILYGFTATPSPYPLEQIVPLSLTSFQPAAPEHIETEAIKAEDVKPLKEKAPAIKKKIIKKKPIKQKIEKQAPAKIKPLAEPQPAHKIIAHNVSIQSVKAVTEKHKVSQAASSVAQQIEQQYTLRLRNLIERQKKYPRRAKRKHEQGTVTVSFTIYTDGHIQNVIIKQSSGSLLLDQNAIRTIKQVSGVLPFPDKINRKQWRFTLPLVYRLHYGSGFY